MLKKLPLGIQTFSKLRENDYVYVDKTEHIYRLIQGQSLFLARPRRFGKSILCSTLVALFQGRKELFVDLWISKNTDYDWPVHPVLYIDFSKIAIKTPEIFNQDLMTILAQLAAEKQIDLKVGISPVSMLRELVPALEAKYNKAVVIIIDEYDRPILHNLTDLDLLKEIQNIIQDFHTCIKALDEYIHFLFVTGISRFSKAGLFSGANQITDISMNPDFAHIVGYTESELDGVLAEHMIAAAKNNQQSLEEFKKLTQEYYNGYRFWANPPASRMKNEIARVYNPFSVMQNLANPVFNCYWFESGTPTFLIKLLKDNDYPVTSFENLRISQDDLGAFEPIELPINTLLYQTGYLTIKEYDAESTNFVLNYPNIEVKEAFLQRVLVWISSVQKGTSNDISVRLIKSLKNNDMSLFIETLKSFYAAIPYTIQLEKEKYYQTIFYIILTLLGIKINVEVATNVGRIDALIQMPDHIYIIEFKLNVVAAQAMTQIKEKKYFEQYQQDPRAITLVGMTFCGKEKNISDFKIEELKNKN